MPASEQPPSNSLGIQDYLSLGYLYLLALGMVSESVYYGLLGVPILSYSDVLDVLLSPLTQMERQPQLFIVLLLATATAFAVLTLARRRHAQRSETDAGYREKLGAEGIAANSLKLQRMQFVLPAFVVFSGYLGFAMGAGRSQAARMADGVLRTDHRVVFANDTTARVRIIGSNSGYLFYVKEGATSVAVSPIKETVRTIQRLEEEP